MLHAHVVVMLYACVVSSCCCKLELYTCALVFLINSCDRPRCSPLCWIHYICNR